MKLRLILASAAIACLGFGAPVFAQTPAPQAEAVLQDFIASHPEVQRDPSLLNNPAYLAAHPKMAHFLETHRYLRAQTMRMGAYDSRHQWRDADWWHRNDPNWVYRNHPEWNESHPAWMNDGDYDDSHRWRNRSWWEQNHPEWVKQHRPHWQRAKERVEEHYEEHHGHGNAYGNPHDQPPGHGKGQGNGTPNI